MGNNIEKGTKIDFGKVTQSERSQSQQEKVRESSQGMSEVEKRVKLATNG